MDEVFRNSLIYIDYETLKLPQTKIALDDKFSNKLINSNAQLIILYKIQQKLILDKKSKNEKVRCIATEVVKLLNSVQAKSNRVKIVGSNDDKDDYMQIYTSCYRFIEKKKQAIITNNIRFANQINRINQQEAVRGMKIAILSINENGKLVEMFKKE